MKYKYKGTEYDSLYLIRQIFPNVSFPAIPSPELLAEFGIEVIEEPPYVRTLDEMKQSKISEIHGISNELIRKVKEGYTDGEITTFDQQYRGAKSIIAGEVTNEDAIFVSQLAAIRSEIGGNTITSRELAEKIIDNHSTAANYITGIIGKQQGLEIKVRACKTIKQVEDVKWGI